MLADSRLLLIVAGLAAGLFGCTSTDPSAGDLTSESVPDPLSHASFALTAPERLDLPAPDIEKLLGEVAALFQNARGFRVTATQVQMGLDSEGNPIPEMVTPPATRYFQFEKPNKLRISAPGEDQIEFIGNGNELVIYAEVFGKRFIREPSPAKMRDLVQNMELMRFGGPTALFPIHFAVDDVTSVLFGAVNSKTYLGAESIDGTPTYHLRFEEKETGAQQAAVAWHAWINAKGPAYIRQVRFEVGKRRIKQGSGLEQEIAIAIVDRFSDWLLDPETTDKTWTFQLPVDARETLSFHSADSALVGTPAPEFVLTNLQGEPVTRTGIAPGRIVVLDFWSTTNDLCTLEMPAMAELAKEYEPLGVSYLAVNQGQSAAEIQAYLKQAGLEIPVLIDEKGETSVALEALKLPHQVVIDKDGIIRAVHTGYFPFLPAVLRKELDLLLGRFQPLTTVEPAAAGETAAPATETPPAAAEPAAPAAKIPTSSQPPSD